jgi:hypothetical protein
MGSVPEDVVATAEVLFRSKLPDIEIPQDLTLQAYCFERLPEVGARPCIIDGNTGAVHTYADVELLSRKAAAALRGLGVGKGDVVMNLLRNCPEFAFVFLGAAGLGAATTTANPFYTPHEIHRQAAAAGGEGDRHRGLRLPEGAGVHRRAQRARGRRRRGLRRVPPVRGPHGRRQRGPARRRRRAAVLVRHHWNAQGRHAHAPRFLLFAMLDRLRSADRAFQLGGTFFLRRRANENRASD